MKQNFPLQMIREKSKMFQVPYENMLIGCAKERLLDSIIKNTSGNSAIVFSAVVGYGIERYRCSKDKTIEIKLLNNGLNDETYDFLEEAILGTGESRLDGQWKIRQETEAEIEVLVPFDKVKLSILVHIEVSPAQKGSIQVVSLPICYENDQYLEIPCFYPEAELAEAFLGCWERMELLQDLSKLEYIYLMGKRFSLDGRRISEYLEYYFMENGLTFSKERSNQVFACVKNAYLKKRWKAYLSTEKRNSPSWEDVMGTICNMYEPVISLLCEQEIFFGDWMPAVGRYL